MSVSMKEEGPPAPKRLEGFVVVVLVVVVAGVGLDVGGSFAAVGAVAPVVLVVAVVVAVGAGGILVLLLRGGHSAVVSDDCTVTRSHGRIDRIGRMDRGGCVEEVISNVE